MNDYWNDQTKQYLGWLIICAVMIAVSTFLGVRYPLPMPPDDITALGTTHFTNVSAEDITATDDLTVGGDLTITGATAFSGDIDLNGGKLDLDADADTSITADTDDQIDIEIGGADNFQFTANTFSVLSGSTLNVDGILDVVTDTEHIGTVTVDKVDIITTTNGTIITIADGEIWIVHNVICHITTNFDCDGDDCTLQIGDGDDPNGLLDLVDAELQAADTEMTGAEAGWQWGAHADTIGAYFTTGNDFIYAPSGAAETIDIDIEDTSGSSNPTAGAATCYIVYTRIQ